MDDSVGEGLHAARLLFTSACHKLLADNLLEEEAQALVAAASLSASFLLNLAQNFSDHASSCIEHQEADRRTSHAEASSSPSCLYHATGNGRKTSLICRDLASVNDREIAYIKAGNLETAPLIETKGSCESLDQELRGCMVCLEDKMEKLDIMEGEHEREVLNSCRECCEALCEAAFRKGLGARVASHLSRAAPQQCASWLDCLKHLTIAFRFACCNNTNWMFASDKRRFNENISIDEMDHIDEKHLGKDRELQLPVSTDDNSKEMSPVPMTFLRWIWSGLKGAGGFLSKNWRTRKAAIELADILTDNAYWGSLEDTEATEIFTELLHQLAITLALSDSHWLVRSTAIKCAAKLLKDLRSVYQMARLEAFIWGLLAASLDKQPEVRDVAVEAILQHLLIPETLYHKECVTHLIDNFVNISVSSTRRFRKWNKSIPQEQWSIDSIHMKLLLSATHGVINLHLLDSVISDEGRPQSERKQSFVPLLVAVAACLLEDAEISQNKSYGMDVSNFLRSLNSCGYRIPVLEMLTSEGPSYSGSSISRWYKESGVLNNEAAEFLEDMEPIIILKALSIAIEGFGHENTVDSAQQGVKSLTGKLEVQALLHVTEVLDIPPSLVSATKETLDAKEADNFLQHTFHMLKLLEAIIKSDCCWLQAANAKLGQLTQDVMLVCAAMASTEDDKEACLWWVSKDIQELAVRIVNCLGTIFSANELNDFMTFEEDGMKIINFGDCIGVERLILRMLPNLLLRFKDQLRDSFSMEEGSKAGAASESASLTTSIITAHQMYWCLKQVKHPRLSHQWELIFPCCLGALDHYSPYVKRQAMKLFIHLANNLNPSELRWYKDPILDCVCRSIIGCGNLWPLVVIMASQLVTCIEGKNPRGRWYRSIFNEMLGELERHPNDMHRCVVWLQHTTELMESMGLVLVMYFRRLLPLLFLWLHSPEDSLCLLVLRTFCSIITYTWPRVPAHVNRFWDEMVVAYKASFGRSSGPSIRSSVIEVCRILKLCGGPAFGELMEKDGDDETAKSLKAVLATAY